MVEMYSSFFEDNFRYVRNAFNDLCVGNGKNNLLAFLCLISALLDKHDTYIIKEKDDYKRKLIPTLLLDLFPREYILEFHKWGIVNFLSNNLKGKKIAHIANFNSRTNRKLIKLISGNDKSISYTKDNFNFTIPQITILTTTANTITDKYLKQNTFIINNLQENFRLKGKFKSPIRERIQQFVLDLDKNYLIEIPYILILRETLNEGLLRTENLQLNVFLQLIQNIALLNQNKRDYYDIKSFNFRVLLAHPLDFKTLLDIENKAFRNLFRVQIDYDEQEENFIELYHRRVNVLKDDSEVNFFQRIQDFEGYE